MLFGVRLRSLFTSRWLALLWAVLVILTAIQFVGPGQDKPADADNATAADGLTNDQRDAVANAL
ncbi:hypothetical protein [Sphingobium sp.]|uniref:hypothetical protein n=1 Tax=Sphingobium sp. TaxID=1912891 RepID=UPI002608286D|nr:hypothetical protein [Sphingobium sp.]